MSVLRCFLIFIGLLVSAASYADTYYWTYSGNPGQQFSSAMSACPSTSMYGDGVHTGNLTGIDWRGDITGRCTYSSSFNDQTVQYNFGSVQRYGDSCPADSLYDPNTGGCSGPALNDGELCDDQSGSNGSSDPMIYSKKAGKCVLFSESDDSATCSYLGSQPGPGAAYSVAGNWDGGTPSAPPVFAQDGLSCEVATVSTTDCVAKGTSGAVQCNVIGKYSGKVSNKTNVADAKDAACPGGTCEPIPPMTNTKNDPCVYSGSGDSVSCTSNTDTSKDGTQKCGSVNGVMTCVTVPPSSNGIKIDSTVKTTPDADGGKTAVKTDTATKTTCTGINKCTTSTSTTTTTTKTNSSGQTTSTSTGCKGVCGSTGTGITPGTPSGDGEGEGEEGSGDCKSEDCGTGGAGGLTDPENGNFDGQGSDWDKKIEESKTKFKDGLSKIKQSFSPISDIQLGSGGGQLYCPPAVTVLGHSIEFCLDKYTDSLSWVASAIYAVCAVFALLIVFG
ncbi:hypothetical protein [Pseudomonas sp. W5-36]|uniref:hypothetical protein n=1 Tax=Pseudomonas sp. W5-36 TaxID=3097455 RepID=UPI00397BF755